MGKRRLQNQSRTDRILIAIALVILLITGAAFYFDGWIWGDHRGRGDKIGLLATKQGDVRMKFEGDIKWQSAARGQDLVYNDSIYAGSGSQAKLALGESEMTVSENTLVVLRRQDQVSFMNLSYGGLFGKIAKNEKIVIDTGDGKPIEMASNDNAQIVVHKTQNGKTELRVTAGTANIVVDGKKAKLDQSSRIVLEKKAAQAPVVAKIEQIAIEALKPRREQVIYSENPTKIDFAWRWSNSRQPASNEDYTLEFSSSPDFGNLRATKVVKGQLASAVPVGESLSYYYRVRGPHGETSQVEKVNFVRLHKPVIVKPVAQAEFLTPANQTFPVELEFQKPQNMALEYQIASDADFKTLVAGESPKDLKGVKALPVGDYFIRARGDLGDGHLTSWTDAQAFRVKPKIEDLKLSGGPLQDKVIIPNAAYPAPLYSAPPAQIRAFLSSRGFLREFFPFAKGSFDQIDMQFPGPTVKGHKYPNQELSQSNAAWPREKLQPGRYSYRYQVRKQGFKPTPWSSDHGLEIVMEPPRAVGEATYGRLKENRERDATFGFTPLLFAKTYDVEVSTDSSFASVQSLSVDKPQATVSLASGEHYWRARARDAKGRVISDYSSAQKMAPMPQIGIPQTLSRNEDRRPQAEEKTSTRVERITEQPFVRNGWWAWIGGGMNYVDYRQSVPGVGTAADHRLKGPSEYGEVGYIGANNWGAVTSFKYTPGEMNIKDNTSASADTESNGTFHTGYTWTTASFEGILRKTSPFKLFDRPIVYGLRVGIQEHRTPFLFINSANNGQLQATTNDMTTASVGLLAEWERRRWTYYWLMRYQYPFTSKSPGAATFNIDPTFAFDGSVGISYNFTQQFKTGIFWYGQWHQYNFTYGDGTTSNTGFQSLFYSNVDLRFGFDF